MGQTTKISWTDKTWNPLRGCSRVSQGCVNCYAEVIAERFSGKGQPFEGFAIMQHGKPHWTGKVQVVEEHLADPLRWKRPARVFVNSMSDLFHESLPDEAIDRVFAVMALRPEHTFQILTKRPERMRKYLSGDREDWVAQEVEARSWAPGVAWNAKDAPPLDNWPLPNVWIGASVENQETADERIPLLLLATAARRFVSYEPALGPVNFKRIEFTPPGSSGGPCFIDSTTGSVFSFGGRSTIPHLDWIIQGCESGRGARPMDIDWARQTRDACQQTGVAFFLKQALNEQGKKVETPELDGRQWMQFPGEVR